MPVGAGATDDQEGRAIAMVDRPRSSLINPGCGGDHALESAPISTRQVDRSPRIGRTKVSVAFDPLAPSKGGQHFKKRVDL
jgi:hypothetical protein